MSFRPTMLASTMRQAEIPPCRHTQCTFTAAVAATTTVQARATAVMAAVTPVAATVAEAMEETAVVLVEAMEVVVATDQSTTRLDLGSIQLLQPQIGDRVRFRAGRAPAALRGREDAIGMVIVLVARAGSEHWPIVHFGDYITTVLPPGLLDVVESVDRS